MSAKKLWTLFTTEREPRIWFYSDDQPRTPSMGLPHVIAVFGRPEEKLLFGYAEFFGAVRVIGVLNEAYDGPPVYFTHAVDPVAGQIRKCDARVDLNREQIISMVTERRLNESEISAQFGAAESAVKNNHYFSKLIDAALKKTLFRPENREKIITPEMINEMTVELVKAHAEYYGCGR